MKFAFPFLRRKNSRTIDWALSRLIPAAALRSLQRGRQRNSSGRVLERGEWIESVSQSLSLDPLKFLEKAATVLRLGSLSTLAPITNDLILATGFSVEELERLKVVPQPGAAGSVYSLALADPSKVSLSEFESLGISLFLCLGSEIEAAWQKYYGKELRQTEDGPERVVQVEPGYAFDFDLSYLPDEPIRTKPEPIFFREDIVPILTSLAHECSRHGANRVSLFNGSRSSYEFSVGGRTYSGTLHRRFMSVLSEFSYGEFSDGKFSHGERSLGELSDDGNSSSNHVDWEPSEGKGLKKAARLALRIGTSEFPELTLESRHRSLNSGSHEASYLLSWGSERDDNTRLVVLIDDDRRFSFLLGEILKKRGYEVTIFSSAKSALEQLESGKLRPRLILCDVHMPDLDGGGFLSRLRERGENTPVLMLTSDDNRMLEAEMARLGASAFLEKREDLAILLAWVDNLLSRDFT